MPIFRSGSGQAPAWCELEYFDIVTLLPGETHTFNWRGVKEKLIVGSGACRIVCAGESRQVSQGSNVDLLSVSGGGGA